MYSNLVLNPTGSCLTIKPTRVIPDLLEDIRTGLLQPPRALPPKYFYDAHGAELFDQITETREYYPTRTEDELLNRYSREIIAHARPDQIIELGSGSSQKTRRLFDACEEHDHVCSYAPFDVCKPMLEETSDLLRDEYDWLDVIPLLGDYNGGLGNLPDHDGSRLYVFLGSTIGNFERHQAEDFLQELKARMYPGDYFLLGFDRIKDIDVLNAAYNDDQGITAEFNLNVLRVLNRELNANFDMDAFLHKAGFNEQLKRIEMHLVSRKDQTVSLKKLNEEIEFSEGEEILTEISCKFSFDEVKILLERCGLELVQHYQPVNKYFSLTLTKIPE